MLIAVAVGVGLAHAEPTAPVGSPPQPSFYWPSVGVSPYFTFGMPVLGPDGQMLVLGGRPGHEAIYRLDARGLPHVFPNGLPDPQSLLLASDRALWEICAGGLARIAHDGAVTHVESSTDLDASTPMAEGANGSIWVEDPGLTLFSRNGTKKSFDVTGPGGYGPGRLVAGLDGSVWFSAQPTGAGYEVAEPATISRLTPNGQITSWEIEPLPETGRIADQVTINGMAQGAGGMWFVLGDGRVGRVSDSGRLQFFARLLRMPAAIARGPDGAMWFTELGASVTRGDHGGNVLGRIDGHGQLTQYHWGAGFPSAAAAIEGGTVLITQGPGQTLWIGSTPIGTDESNVAFGRIDVTGRCDAPDLVGTTLHGARAVLRSAGCRLGSVRGPRGGRSSRRRARRPGRSSRAKRRLHWRPWQAQSQ